ncbi:hypothetical protein LZQ00_04110 [Sphingobacterium sp. SRCM116780]|uniref:hypothetical protein n=1 Tax=Sphingobacterium sp. SRCM116780 TaxID=2907623 RepID=UPI001F3FC3C0|nr:hypothetical protein [Sphingobacterium sp. SRCM116780]UIR57004.1 hypothetical protein LZQ00_04110 [Sphingobacterium sp. SRCM116780]
MSNQFYKFSNQKYILKKPLGMTFLVELLFITVNIYLLLMSIIDKEIDAPPYLFLFIFTLLPAFLSWILLFRKIMISPSIQQVQVKDLGFYNRKYQFSDFINFEFTKHHFTVIPIGYAVSLLFDKNGKTKKVEIRRFRTQIAAQKFIANTHELLNTGCINT